MASIKAIAAIALTLMIAAPIGLGYLFASEETHYNTWETDNRVNMSDMILNHEYPIYMPYTGTTNNTNNGDTNAYEIVYVEVGSSPTPYPALTPSTVSISFAADTPVDLSAYSYWKATVPAGIKYAINDNSYYYNPDGDLISGHGGTLKLNAAATLDVTTYTDSGDYANIDYGWKFADPGARWKNNQVNESVTVLIDLPVSKTVNIMAGVTLVGITRDSTGMVKIANTSHVLGNYDYIRFTYGANEFVLEGLSEWPAFGSNPEIFNRITIPRNGVTFQELVFISTAYNDIVYRVESAEIAAGSFPSTLDYTLDMGAQFPGKSYNLKLNSIGIYGDTLTFGGHAYAVNNGGITVDGVRIGLKGVVLSSVWNGTVYENKIGGHVIGTTADPATLIFGGEWSTTLTADILKQTTGTRTEWQPGEFAFDKQDFAACGLIVAGVLMIGFGLYGRNSGVKVGLLMLVCGGAALAYLSMI